jgi:hypothetical protein
VVEEVYDPMLVSSLKLPEAPSALNLGQKYPFPVTTSSLVLVMVSSTATKGALESDQLVTYPLLALTYNNKGVKTNP